MASMGDRLIAYWKQASAFTTIAASALLTFSGLIDVPLDLRLFLVGVFGATFTVFFVLSLGPASTQGVAGFGVQTPRQRFRRLVIVGKIAVVLLACAVAMGLLHFTLTFHDISLSQTTNERDTRAGTITLVPSHLATDVTMTFATPQPNVHILDLDPQDCGAAPISNPNIQDPTEFSETLHLFGFKTPQRLCIPYRLSDRADRLKAVAIPAVSSIDVLSDGQMESYQMMFFVFGGILCVFALLLFFFRYSWSRRHQN
jgi:hypothetical protein